MLPDPARPRMPADTVRAIRESPAFAPRTMHGQQRVAFGVALAADICANPALLERGVTTAARWMAEGNVYVPRSPARLWRVLRGKARWSREAACTRWSYR